MTRASERIEELSQTPSKRKHYLHPTLAGTKLQQRSMDGRLCLWDSLIHWRCGVSRNRLSGRASWISVIDDDQSVSRTTALLVESFGFRAAAFGSVEAFLESGRLRDTSCLIVDVQMPGMNGLELQSRLAAMGSPIPIIFMTAYYREETHRRAMRAGAVAFLGKPFADDELLQTIRSALARR